MPFSERFSACFSAAESRSKVAKKLNESRSKVAKKVVGKSVETRWKTCGKVGGKLVENSRKLISRRPFHQHLSRR